METLGGVVMETLDGVVGVVMETLGGVVIGLFVIFLMLIVISRELNGIRKALEKNE